MVEGSSKAMKSPIMINIIIMSVCIFLSGCTPCKFLDWNCTESTKSFEMFSQCRQQQQTVARKSLGKKYNDVIDDDIYYKCLDKSSYKFESDPKYKVK